MFLSDSSALEGVGIRKAIGVGGIGVGLVATEGLKIQKTAKCVQLSVVKDDWKRESFGEMNKASKIEVCEGIREREGDDDERSAGESPSRSGQCELGFGDSLHDTTPFPVEV